MPDIFIVTAVLLAGLWAPVHAACPIYFTLALNGNVFNESHLVINWGPNCNRIPHNIGIYTEDPSVSIMQPIYQFSEVANLSGSVVTSIKVGELIFPKGWNHHEMEDSKDVLPKISGFGKEQCIKYFLASFIETELMAVECLKIRPNWMSNIQGLAEMQLKDLFLPGTHASGAFAVTPGINQTTSELQDFLVTQYFNVWYQMVFGIRYLDFSIGYSLPKEFDKDYNENFYIVSEHTIMNPLRSILKDIRHFVEVSHEVVILDFSSFPIGFYKHQERHTELVHLIYDELGEVLYKQESDVSLRKPCYNLTLADITNTNRYVIVLYPLEELQHPDNESPFLCGSWKTFSSSFMNMSQTLDLMQALFSKRNASLIQNEGWIFNAITSMEQALNEDSFKSAKKRAEAINEKVVSWLTDAWGMNANVVTLDYFSSTNMIDVAVESNVRKAYEARNKKYVQFEILD